MRLGLILFISFLMSALAVAEPTKFELSQGGSHIGDNVYDRHEDGTFTSKTLIEVANVKIDSSIEGRFEGTKLTECTVHQVGNGSDVTIKYANGRVSATVNGKDQGTSEFKLTDFVYSNYHPGLSSTIIQNLNLTGPEPKQVSLCLLDNGAKLDCAVALGNPRTVNVNGKSETIRIFKLVIAAVEIEYAANQSGEIVAEQVVTQKLKIVAENYENVFADPVLRYKELSQPTFKVKVERGTKIALRDGTILVHDVAMPDAPGKYPVILTRTPYGRSAAMIGSEWWASRGYVFIAQDVRGRHDSGGAWDPFVGEQKDGKDTIDWIAKQPWSNGRVGMIGASYGGMVQWAAAVEKPAALKCIVPQVSPPDAMRNIPFDNGVFMLMPNLWWTNLVRDKVSHMERATQPLPHPENLGTLPLSKLDDKVLGVNVPFFDNWLKRDGMNKWDNKFDFVKRLNRVEIPALHISGWWDGDGIGTKTNWAEMRRAGRKNQWLIYGPWPHGFNVSTKFGDEEYGPTSVRELDSVYLRWFDTWLKGKEVGFDKVPKVQAFLTGANKWLALSDWPMKSSPEKVFYLQDGGKLAKSAADSKPGRYTYDPAKVTVPKEAANNLMAQGSLVVDLKGKPRAGLIYQSDRFESPTALGGPISVDLYFSTDVVATDFFGFLCDVDEKGVARIVGLPGKIDVRYMNGLDKPRLITPGKVYHAKFDLWDTAREFQKGHRLAFFLSSDMFPTYARNLNTGEPVFSATRMKVAHTTIYQDKRRPSSIRLRVLPRN